MYKLFIPLSLAFLVGCQNTPTTTSVPMTPLTPATTITQDDTTSIANQVNVAFQVMPNMGKSNIHPWTVVDVAIATIKASGIKYEVCPMETVMEGDYDEIMALIKKVVQECYAAGAEKVYYTMKVSTSSLEDVTIESKMHQYRK